RDRQHEIEPVDREPFGMERRSDEPEDVDEPHRDQEQRDLREHLRVALDPPPQEQEEREGEVEEDERERDDLPPAARPREAPRRPPPDAARPDDQELREGRVGPQQQERERQVAEVVKMVGGEPAPERLAALEPRGCDEGERERRESLADDEDHAV